MTFSLGASAIAYSSIVSFIFAIRYFDVIRWAFKLSSMALAITVAAEVAGKAVLSHGLATQMRPRRYYTVSRSTLDNMIGDVHELVNFFVIEAQRILFVENTAASVAVSSQAIASRAQPALTWTPRLASLPSYHTTSLSLCPTGDWPSSQPL